MSRGPALPALMKHLAVFLVDPPRIGSQLSDDERDPLSHQTADEMDVAAEPIELRDDDRAFQPAGHLESRGKLRPALKRVSAWAGTRRRLRACTTDELARQRGPRGQRGRGGKGGGRTPGGRTPFRPDTLGWWVQPCPQCSVSDARLKKSGPL